MSREDKMIVKNTVTCCLLLLLISCTTPQSKQQASTDSAKNKDDIGYVCKRVKKTGSSVPTKVCSTRAQREASKLKAKRMLNESRHLQQKDDVN